MMERDYGQEKRDIASKIAEKKNQEIIDKKLDRINFLLERNKKLNDEKNSIIGSLSVKIADQGEEYNIEEQRIIENIDHHPESSPITYRISEIDLEIKRNEEELKKIKENLSKIT
ncbi:MAG: hypothetical protein KBC44_00775 [Candidatus Pacebacteria bacterium]|nr:hypothetical protein [Candidatus Paceibacterota bacterium]MBP9839496.1 hypothetical protein [Candidatus Paceibacterota bacterium]